MSVEKTRKLSGPKRLGTLERMTLNDPKHVPYGETHWDRPAQLVVDIDKAEGGFRFAVKETVQTVNKTFSREIVFKLRREEIAKLIAFYIADTPEPDGPSSKPTFHR